MKVKATIVLGMFGLVTALSACGGSEEEMATYCVDAAGVVVDEDYCDPDDDLYNPVYLVWYSDDDHKYKKGKKIPSADFRKGTTSAPSSAKPSPKATSSTSKPSTASKPSANAPKPQAPKPAPAPKPQAPKPPPSSKK